MVKSTRWVVLACTLFAGLAATTAMAVKKDKPDFIVDCSKGETVQAIVDAALPGDIIEVSGVCNENVLIEKDRITLDGGGTAEIHGVDGSFLATTVVVSGASNVTIRSFALITGSSIGVRVRDNGHAIIGGEETGEGNLISGNTFTGIAVGQSSDALIDSNVISNDGVSDPVGGSGGLNISGNASAIIIGNDIIDNGQSGLIVLANSDAGLGGNLISGNAFGVFVLTGSSLRMTRFVTRAGLGPNQITANDVFGLSCQIGGSIFIADSQNGVPDVLLTASGNGFLDLVTTESCAVFTGNTGLVFDLVPGA